MPFETGRRLVRGEFYVDVATQDRSIYEGRGLIRTERVRKRYIRPRRYWGNPVNPIIATTGLVIYPYHGGGYYPA